MAVNVVNSNRRIGFELEMYSTVPTYEEITYRNFFWGDTVDDGSIEPDCGYNSQSVELRSKPTIAKEIPNIVETIHKNFIKKYECQANSSCGFHVHLDMTNSTKRQRENIKQWWVAYEDAFRSLVPRYRRHSYWCQSVKEQSKYSMDDWDRDSTLNPWAFNNHGTFEVRLHQGTVEKPEIINWINLLTLFFDTFQDKPFTETRGTLKSLFTMIKAPKVIRSYFYAKAKRYNEKSTPVRARSAINS